MPELPEVETVRRRLAPLLTGRTLAAVTIHDPRLVAPALPEAVATRLTGTRIDAVDRRGKYLLLRLENGDVLAVHLRMTGNLLHGSERPVHPQLRAEATLDDASLLAFCDQRRFGTWHLLDADEVDPYLAARLGPEPMSPAFDHAVLRRALHGRRAPVKAILLDQRVVAGVGNIYADEALHRARVHPETPGGAVSSAAAGRLVGGIRDSLTAGIEAQGASIRDYRTPSGGRGSMQERFRVFDRTGQPCPECGTAIVKLRVAGRGTHVCPTCQRRRRLRPPRPAGGA